jgi:hypothetical protein
MAPAHTIMTITTATLQPYYHCIITTGAQIPDGDMVMTLKT